MAGEEEFGDKGEVRMRFVNMTNNASLNEAAQKAEMLLEPGSKMLWELWHKDDFKYETEKNGDHYLKLIENREPVKILTYKPLWRFTSAIAMTSGDGAIHFNIYKLDKTSLASKVGTILHEYAHICGFKHGNNYRTKEKDQFSVPYYLSSNVEKWL